MKIIDSITVYLYTVVAWVKTSGFQSFSDFRIVDSDCGPVLQFLKRYWSVYIHHGTAWDIIVVCKLKWLFRPLCDSICGHFKISYGKVIY
jgi:hypothetical protein